VPTVRHLDLKALDPWSPETDPVLHRSSENRFGAASAVRVDPRERPGSAEMGEGGAMTDLDDGWQRR
jgi:hypothetical protein